MKEQSSIRDVVEKMSQGIKDRYFESKTQRESEDKWEILQAFMKKQVEISRSWVRVSATSSADKTADVKCHNCQETGHVLNSCPDVQMNVVNSATIRSQQAEFTPCSVCQEIHTFTHSSGEVRNSTRFADCGKFRDLDLEDQVKVGSRVSWLCQMHWLDPHQG